MNTAYKTTPSGAEPELTNNKSGKLLAATILGTPLLIVIVTSLMYFNNWMTPEGRVNHGLLLTPVIQITQLTAQPEPNLVIDKWQLILRVEGPCGSSCETWIRDLRQLHVALGKFESRVSRLYLSDRVVPELVNEVGHYRTIVSSLTSFSDLSDQLVKSNGWVNSESTSIFISDPLGNIMLHYNESVSPRDIIADIKKMLKLSMIG